MKKQTNIIHFKQHRLFVIIQKICSLFKYAIKKEYRVLIFISIYVSSLIGNGILGFLPTLFPLPIIVLIIFVVSLIPPLIAMTPFVKFQDFMKQLNIDAKDFEPRLNEIIEREVVSLTNAVKEVSKDQGEFRIRVCIAKEELPTKSLYLLKINDISYDQVVYEYGQGVPGYLLKKHDVKNQTDLEDQQPPYVIHKWGEHPHNSPKVNRNLAHQMEQDHTKIVENYLTSFGFPIFKSDNNIVACVVFDFVDNIERKEFEQTNADDEKIGDIIIGMTEAVLTEVVKYLHTIHLVIGNED